MSEALVPHVAIVTEIRTETPDVKTFRLEAKDGGKQEQHQKNRNEHTGRHDKGAFSDCVHGRLLSPYRRTVVPRGTRSAA